MQPRPSAVNQVSFTHVPQGNVEKPSREDRKCNRFTTRVGRDVRLVPTISPVRHNLSLRGTHGTLKKYRLWFKGTKPFECRSTWANSAFLSSTTNIDSAFALRHNGLNVFIPASIALVFQPFVSDRILFYEAMISIASNVRKVNKKKGKR